MNAKTQKQRPVVTLRIEHGPVSPHMRAQWRKLWARLLQKAQEGVTRE